MDDEMIVQLYLERNEQAIPETETKYGDLECGENVRHDFRRTPNSLLHKIMHMQKK